MPHTYIEYKYLEISGDNTYQQREIVILLRINQQKIGFLVILRVFQTIDQFTARQLAKLPKSKTGNSSFSCTAAFPGQRYSQPQSAAASPNKEALIFPEDSRRQKGRPGGPTAPTPWASVA
jgi:hypothetical protein